MDGYVTIGTSLDESMIDKQISLLQDKLEGLVEEYEILEKAQPFEGQTEELIKLGKEINSTKNELSKLVREKEKMTSVGFSGVATQVEGIGKSITRVTKKAVRWGLAIFGIRSAYLAIRSAMNTLTSQDEQLAADIDYIKNALAYTLEPIIRRIVELIKQLMYYVGYIINQWTGKNIFENANKSLKSANKQATKLSKTLAGFDEMNVLSNSSSSASGAATPSFDLSAMDGNVPEWIEWIAKNGDNVIRILGGLAAGLIAIKNGLDGIKALGIGTAVYFVVKLIQDIITYLNDPTFTNFTNILQDIAGAIAGVAIAIGAWPVAIGAAVAFVMLEIVKHFDEIKGLFNTLIGWLDTNVLGGLRRLFGPVGDILYAPIKMFAEYAKATFESFYGGIKQVIEGVMKIFNGDFLGGIKDIFGGLLNILTAPIQGLWKAIKEIVPLILGAFKQIGTKVGEVISGAFKAVINGVLSAIEKILNTPIKAVNGLINTINKIPGINIGKLSTFNLPRLAKGGILNQPGRGVMVGNAIAGEGGKELYMPLQDEQMLNMVGQAIGKYITINANITNTMNGRVISRELQKVQNDSDFAFNR